MAPKNTIHMTVLWATFALLGCGGDKLSYSEIVDAAWTAFADGDYEAAVEIFSEATAKNPDRAEAFTGLGWSYLRLGQPDPADSSFENGAL